MSVESYCRSKLAAQPRYYAGTESPQRTYEIKCGYLLFLAGSYSVKFRGRSTTKFANEKRVVDDSPSEPFRFFFGDRCEKIHDSLF